MYIYGLPSAKQWKNNIFFRYHVITKCIYKAPAKGRKEYLMKLGQGLKTLITKYGRIILDKEGSKWDVLTALENTVSQITGTKIEMYHEESALILYQDDTQIEWVADGLTSYELYLLAEALQGLIKDKGYKVQLVEA